MRDLISPVNRDEGGVKIRRFDSAYGLEVRKNGTMEVTHTCLFYSYYFFFC